MIRTIEIICKPCRKCELLAERINHVLQSIQFLRNIRLKIEIKLNNNIFEADRYGYNFTQLPILLINGNVEFVGHVKEVHLIRMKLEDIMKEG